MKNYVLEEHNMPKSTTWRAAAYGNGIYVAVGDGGVAVSSDGANWKMTVDINIEQAGPNHYWSVAYGNGRFVSIKQTGEVYVSTDGKNWTKSKGGAGSYYVTYGNGKFVSGSGSISEDGLTWSGSWHKKWTPESEPPYSIEDSAGVCYGNGKFVSLGLRGEIYTRSCDEVDWRITYAAADWDKAEGFAPPTVVYRNGLFFACNCQQVLMSRNGETWEEVVKLEAPKAVYNVMGMDGCYFAYTSGAMMESEDGISWKNSSAARFNVSCQGPNGFIGLYGDKCYSMMFQEYIPDAVTLVDGGEAPGDLRYMAAAGWDGAQVGQVFGKLDTATFGFRDIESCVPKNEKYVYCDGKDDYLKIQAAIDEVEDTSIPTVIYPVGECVLDITGFNEPPNEYEMAYMVDLKNNVTIDGRYCKIVLDTTKTCEVDRYIVVFKAGNDSGLVNCQICGRGENTRKYILFTSGTANTGGVTYRTVFANNKISDIKVQLSTHYYVRGYIYVYDGVIEGNEFWNIEIKGGDLVNSDCDIIRNRFHDCTFGNYFIETNGRHFMNNVFERITSSNMTGNVIKIYSGAGHVVTGNHFEDVMLTRGSILYIDSYGGSVRDNFVLISLTAESNVVTMRIIRIEGEGTVVSGNAILLFKDGDVECTIYPYVVNGLSNIVTDNMTNCTSIGTIGGEGTVQSNNIATGETAI